MWKGKKRIWFSFCLSLLIFLSLASPYLLLLFLGLGSLSVFFGEKTEENNNGGEKGRGKWGFVKGVGVLCSSVELINSIDVLENYIYAISFFYFYFIIICPSMEKLLAEQAMSLTRIINWQEKVRMDWIRFYFSLLRLMAINR